MTGLICRHLVISFCFLAGCDSERDHTTSPPENDRIDPARPTKFRSPPASATADTDPAASARTAIEAAKAIDALLRNRKQKPYSDQDVQEIITNYAHLSNQSIGKAAVKVLEADANLGMDIASVFSWVRKSPNDSEDFILSASPGDVRDAAVDVLGSALVRNHPDILGNIYEKIDPGADRNVIAMHLTQSVLATRGLAQALETVGSLDFPEEKDPSFTKLRNAIHRSEIDYFTTEPGTKERFEAMGRALGIPTGKGVSMRPQPRASLPRPGN